MALLQLNIHYHFFSYIIRLVRELKHCLSYVSFLQDFSKNGHIKGAIK